MTERDKEMLERQVELLRRMSPRLDMLDCENVLTAADLIEELVKERDEERTKRKMAEGLAGLSSADIDGHSAMITVARDAVAKRIAAEAKLSKAVEALRYADQMVWLDLRHKTDFDHEDFSQAVFDTGKRIAAVLAELEGGE